MAAALLAVAAAAAAAWRQLGGDCVSFVVVAGFGWQLWLVPVGVGAAVYTAVRWRGHCGGSVNLAVVVGSLALSAGDFSLAEAAKAVALVAAWQPQWL